MKQHKPNKVHIMKTTDKDYRQAETYTHMLNKIEDLMILDKRLTDVVEAIEQVKKQIAKVMLEDGRKG